MQIVSFSPWEQKNLLRAHAKIYKGGIVTNTGLFFSIIGKKRLSVCPQNLSKQNNGYFRASIKHHYEYIHRIVAKCFVANPKNYCEVNHIDGNKAHNTAANLEWCTRAENNQHAFRIGLRTNAQMSKIAKLPKYRARRFSNDQITAIRTMIASGMGDSLIAKKFGCSKGPIYQIRNHKTYKESSPNA